MSFIIDAVFSTAPDLKNASDSALELIELIMTSCDVFEGKPVTWHREAPYLYNELVRRGKNPELLLDMILKKAPAMFDEQMEVLRRTTKRVPECTEYLDLVADRGYFVVFDDFTYETMDALGVDRKWKLINANSELLTPDQRLFVETHGV